MKNYMDCEQCGNSFMVLVQTDDVGLNGDYIFTWHSIDAFSSSGGLSGKYPAYPQTSTGYDPYSQTPYSQPGYNPTSNPYSTASSYR